MASLGLQVAQDRVAGADHGAGEHAGQDHERVVIFAASAIDRSGVLPRHTMFSMHGPFTSLGTAGLLERLRRLDEGHVGAGLEGGVGAPDRFLEAQRRRANRCGR